MNPFGIPEVPAQEVKRLLEKGDPLILLDVREHDEVAMASIKGAVHIPMGEVGHHLADLPKDKDIVVFCHMGSRSLMVAYQLKRRGFARVFSMEGGIDAWSRDVDPQVPQYE